jgi:hypothetical protein
VLDEASRALLEAVYRELYLCEPSDDGGNPFGLKYIRSNIAEVSKKPTAAFGGDLAKSIDLTVLHGLDDDGCTTEHHRFQLPWKATIDRIRLICGYTTTHLDSTGVGVNPDPPSGGPRPGSSPSVGADLKDPASFSRSDRLSKCDMASDLAAPIFAE